MISSPITSWALLGKMLSGNTFYYEESLKRSTNRQGNSTNLGVLQKAPFKTTFRRSTSTGRNADLPAASGSVLTTCGFRETQRSGLNLLTIREIENASKSAADLRLSCPRSWIKDRVIIDPLIDVYRAEERRLTGKTFFTDDIRTFAMNAEVFIKDLAGAVDGCIVCQNTLDHCRRPLKVLKNLARYAAPGCFFLLWTDIWHPGGLDTGHRNITKSEGVMDDFLQRLGFEIVKKGRKIRGPKEYVEYGRIAVKR